MCSLRAWREHLSRATRIGWQRLLVVSEMRQIEDGLTAGITSLSPPCTSSHLAASTDMGIEFLDCRHSLAGEFWGGGGGGGFLLHKSSPGAAVMFPCLVLAALQKRHRGRLLLGLGKGWSWPKTALQLTPG